jgi:4-hydroxy-tetrahydrodipicolinate reductase
MSKQTLRVVQFATGNVGSEMVRRIVEHPDLELVGLYCYGSVALSANLAPNLGVRA